jgi:hypothetical protein
MESPPEKDPQRRIEELGAGLFLPLGSAEPCDHSG